MKLQRASDDVLRRKSPATPAATPAAPTTCSKSPPDWRSSPELGPPRSLMTSSRCAAEARAALRQAGEEHYNLISALHKSVRNSDPDAALYWLGRMLEAGEDPLYIARRVVRMAVEDIGLADPNALSLCMAARDAVDFIGMPEGNLALAQAVVYLSVAPKSNALYTAYGEVQQDVEQTAAEPVPLHLRNAPTGLDEGPGLWQGLSIRHDVEGKVANMQCLPDNLRNRVYYHPTNEGIEKRIRERMEEIKRAKTAEGCAKDQFNSRPRSAHRQHRK
jgi:replication-associated recombination protein RarA